MSSTATTNATKRARGLVAIAAFAFALLFHAAQIPSQGLTDDDDFYAPAGIRYAEWLSDAVTHPSLAFTQASIESAFKLNHEHPPGAKIVFGVAHALGRAIGFGDLDAARLGCALFAAALASLLVLLLWEPLGVLAAVSAPLLLLSLPRFTFHSEVATLDVPVACAVFAITAAYFAAEAQRARLRAVVVVGVIFALGNLVKLNAPFAIIPCALWSLLLMWRGFRVDNAALVIPPIPRSLVAMIIAAPILFVLLWPWLWFDTVDRVGAYIAFHLQHYPIYLFYDGEIWEKPFAPWHAVLFLGLGSLPAPVLALGAVGSLRALASIARCARDTPATASAADKLRALLLLQAAFAMALVADPATPRYGGEKLFMPFFPLFIALAADGLAFVVDGVRAGLPLLARSRLRARAVAVLAVALACAPGAFANVKLHGGYALSYYGELVGGLRGAVARGYERTYYDVADKPLAHWLDDNAHGARVHFEPNHKEYARTYRWLKRDGVIGDGLILDDNKARANLIVLTHERRWSTYPALKAELEKLRVVDDKSIDGVSLYTVYAR
ncbi:MAG TPA: hypothetical protein VGO62_16950 [Myxococcota bacterium]